MAYDAPAGANNFRYRVGMNLDANGNAASWGNIVEVGGVGWEGQGAGITFTNLDNNPRPEMLLMAYDNPSGPNTFRYRVGWNVDAAGNAASWAPYITVPGVGNEGAGADLDVADLDQNGRPDLILLAYDDPSGPNGYRYRIGWNLDGAGATGDWQDGYVPTPARATWVRARGSRWAIWMAVAPTCCSSPTTHPREPTASGSVSPTTSMPRATESITTTTRPASSSRREPGSTTTASSLTIIASAAAPPGSRSRPRTSSSRWEAGVVRPGTTTTSRAPSCTNWVTISASAMAATAE